MSSLKFTKLIDVVGCHGVTKGLNSIDLSREKADENFENAQW